MKYTPVLFVALAFAFHPSAARATSVTSTVSEDNGATATTGHGANQAIFDVPANHPAVVTTAGGFDFSSGANNFANLGGTIASISFSMTMIDGDSGSTDFDFNHLFLYLGNPADYNSTTGILTGGVNTGIVLNGFRGLGLLDTQTFSMNISGAISTALLSELTAGAGHLSAWVVSDNSADTVNAANEVFAGNDAHNATTSLTLSNVAVPEPATYALAGMGLLLLIAPRVRRLRRHF